jgi:hypothetical protein
VFYLKQTGDLYGCLEDSSCSYPLLHAQQLMARQRRQNSLTVRGLTADLAW